MSTILRPVKTAGTRNYASEVAAGQTDVKPTEIDGDLNTIYADHNGGIDNTNINASAGIAKSKLNLLNGIVNADVNTAAAIEWSKIAVPPGGAITKDQLVPGSTLWDNAQHVRTDSEAQVGSTPLIYLTMAGLQGRLAAFGPLIIQFGLMGDWSVSDAAVQTSIIIRLLENGSPIITLPAIFAQASGGIIPWAASWSQYISTGAGDHTYSVQVYQPGPNYTYNQVTCGYLIGIALS